MGLSAHTWRLDMILFCRDEDINFMQLYICTISGVLVHVLERSKEINQNLHKHNGKSFVSKDSCIITPCTYISL